MSSVSTIRQTSISTSSARPSSSSSTARPFSTQTITSIASPTPTYVSISDTNNAFLWPPSSQAFHYGNTVAVIWKSNVTPTEIISNCSCYHDSVSSNVSILNGVTVSAQEIHNLSPTWKSLSYSSGNFVYGSYNANGISDKVYGLLVNLDAGTSDYCGNVASMTCVLSMVKSGSTVANLRLQSVVSGVQQSTIGSLPTPLSSSVNQIPATASTAASHPLSTTSESYTTSAAPSQNSTYTGIIAGIAVGGAVVLAVICTLIYCCCCGRWKKNRARRHAARDTTISSDNVDSTSSGVAVTAAPKQAAIELNEIHGDDDDHDCGEQVVSRRRMVFMHHPDF